jgi:hypothetical protein
MALRQLSAAVPGHPDALMLSAFAADAAAHIRPGGAVLQVVRPRSSQGSI